MKKNEVRSLGFPGNSVGSFLEFLLDKHQIQDREELLELTTKIKQVFNGEEVNDSANIKFILKQLLRQDSNIDQTQAVEICLYSLGYEYTSSYYVHQAEDLILFVADWQRQLTESSQKGQKKTDQNGAEINSKSYSWKQIIWMWLIKKLHLTSDVIIEEE